MGYDYTSYGCSSGDMPSVGHTLADISAVYEYMIQVQPKLSDHLLIMKKKFRRRDHILAMRISILQTVLMPLSCYFIHMFLCDVVADAVLTPSIASSLRFFVALSLRFSHALCHGFRR
jgi:hypothetical protein